MADYFAILKRAVDGLPDGTREQRQAIYDKARKALLGQLQNMDPPLAASEISKQRVALEEAVRAVELDLMRQNEARETDGQPRGAERSRKEKAEAASATIAPTAPKVAEAATPAKAPNVELSSNVEPSSTSDKADGKAVVAASADDKKPEQDAAEPTAVPSDKVVRRAGQDVLKNAVRDAKALGSATSAAVKSAQETADIVGEQRDSDVARIEPTLGDAVVTDAKTYKREPVAISGDTPLSSDGALDEKDEEKGSNFGVIVGMLLITVLLGSSGYLLYQNRDAFVGDDGEGGKSVVSQDETGASASKDGDSKSDVGIAAKTVRTVTVKPEDSQPAETAGELVETKADDKSAVETRAEETAPTNVAVAQRSILYEEASAGSKSGRASAGQALWQLEGSGENAAIVVSAAIPDRSAEFKISIRKNADVELPASHLIEIEARHADTAEPRVIDKIPGLILKPTEQSRGEGLVGASIRISDDLYWIALTAGEREVKYNMELLELRSWIDMPIQYKSGRRAILTLEKGDKGDDVIKQAIKAWGQS